MRQPASARPGTVIWHIGCGLAARPERPGPPLPQARLWARARCAAWGPPSSRDFRWAGPCGNRDGNRAGNRVHNREAPRWVRVPPDRVGRNGDPSPPAGPTWTTRSTPRRHWAERRSVATGGCRARSSHGAVAQHCRVAPRQVLWQGTRCGAVAARPPGPRAGRTALGFLRRTPRLLPPQPGRGVAHRPGDPRERAGGRGAFKEKPADPIPVRPVKSG